MPLVPEPVDIWRYSIPLCRQGGSFVGCPFLDAVPFRISFFEILFREKWLYTAIS
jgi:hypothetical protein